MSSIPFFVFLVALFLFNPTCIFECRAGVIGTPKPPLEQKMESGGKHFVLVHGSNFGAWSWYKLITLLKSAGHRVTAFDLAANGVDPRWLDEVSSFFEYVQPLTDFMASLPNGENFSEKISVAVFVSAFMPNYSDPPVTILQAIVSILFGPELITTKLYNDSPTEDAELAKKLVRPTGFFMDDLSKSLLTKNNYGSVTRVFIITGDDQILLVDSQKYIIENSPPKEVKSIAGSDHMVMISKPKELYNSLEEIADTYN